MPFLAFFLLSVAAALQTSDTHYRFDTLNDACPSNSLLYNECHSFNRPSSSHSLRENKTQQIDDSHEELLKRGDFPWSYWPECFINGDMKEPVCAFSHHSFANRRGVSLVTTANDAYSILSLPAFTNLDSHHRVNVYSSPPYIEREIPGRGRGLIANKSLHRGDLIFASTPILIMNPDAYDLDEEERLKLARRAVETLPENTQSIFWELLGHFGSDPVDDRINTNAFEHTVNGHTHHLVFPEIARINHDCRPNAAYFFDLDTLTQYVHATTDVPAGTEITITYINYEMIRQQRMNALEESWGFKCSCSACSAPPVLTSQSDARLSQIPELEDMLDDWSEDSPATPEMAQYLISIYEQERLYAGISGAYKQAALAYSGIGDRWNSIKYARLAVEMGFLDNGFAEDVWQMKRLAEEPEMSWSWRKRVRGCSCGRH